VNEIQEALADSHAHPPMVTRAMRAAHLGVTALLVSPGLLAMTLICVLLATWQFQYTQSQRNAAVVLNAGIADPAVLEKWRRVPRLRDRLDDARLPEVRDRIIAYHATMDSLLDAEFNALTKAERFAITRLGGIRDTAMLKPDNFSPETAADLIRYIDDQAVSPRNESNMRKQLLATAVVLCATILTGYAILAFAFRGGLAYLLSGIALVRRNGRPAGRIRCALREFVIWLPLVLMLLLNAAVQALWPGWFLGRIGTGFSLFVVVLVYAAGGIRYPEQGPHDRLSGTVRVPV
jgi:hypothetical protein